MVGTEPVIRKMEITDLESVHAIESASFPNTSWTLEAFIRELSVNKSAHYFVLEINGRIIGYCGMWLGLDQSQITTIAIANEERGNGYGKQLLIHAKDYARDSTDILSLEVSVDNTSAMNLYEKEAFNYGGVRKNYYGPGKDAHVMRVKLND